MLAGKRILLVISGGVAAYKACELIRRLRDRGVDVRCVVTAGAQKFVTPMTFAALSENPVFTDLFSLKDEAEMGHIRLSREADMILVAPASANMLARMAAGMADDLAATVLLASDKPILVAPSMNAQMWQHPATQANMALLEQRGVKRVGPDDGDLACGEIGSGRLAETQTIIAAAAEILTPRPQPLKGKRALVTSGPTIEPLDPVRYMTNRSSGKQGHAIAQALANLGAEVALVTGPTQEPDPIHVTVRRIETAEQMLEACIRSLPVDIAVFAAAVADWRAAALPTTKIKKQEGVSPTLHLVENADILATIARRTSDRPALVIGFAAETGEIARKASEKRLRKGCDWIIANDVSLGTEVFGGDKNTVLIIDKAGVESWPTLSKQTVSEKLADRIVHYLSVNQI
jgi:phosphopantothenoylcysteine decarboxylase/phosphopantothenate--cysteine ligase